jgi:hypothetical protein
MTTASMSFPVEDPAVVAGEEDFPAVGNALPRLREAAGIDVAERHG